VEGLYATLFAHPRDPSRTGQLDAYQLITIIWTYAQTSQRVWQCQVLDLLELFVVGEAAVKDKVNERVSRSPSTHKRTLHESTHSSVSPSGRAKLTAVKALEERSLYRTNIHRDLTVGTSRAETENHVQHFQRGRQGEVVE
jgi:hypothetical protein